MEQTLAYLRESLSNYTDKHEMAQHIYSKLKRPFESEKQFVDALEQEEVQYLNDILPDEIDYAQNEKDDKRHLELTNVYEQLY